MISKDKMAEFIYKIARIMSGAFIAFLVLVTTSPFVIVALKGVDESTVPMLFASLFFLVFLVFFALSFRFMSKKEPLRKRRIGLLIFSILMLSLFIYSLYAEKKRQEILLAQQHYLAIEKQINNDKAIATALKGLFEDMDKRAEELSEENEQYIEIIE